MTLYICKKCKNEKKLLKATICVIDEKLEVKQALCKCGKYMKAKPVDGMPSLIRTEETLKKN